MTYTEAIDSLFVMLESIYDNYDYEIIVEAVDENDDDKRNKFLNNVRTVVNKIWAFIKKAATKIMNTIKGLIHKIQGKIGKDAFLKSKAITAEDCELPDFVLRSNEYKSTLIKIRNATRSNTGVKKDLLLIHEIENMLEMKSVPAGTVVGTIKGYTDISVVLNDIASYNPVDKNNGTIGLYSKMTVEEGRVKNDLVHAVSKLYPAYFSTITKITTDGDVEHNKDISDRIAPKAESTELTSDMAYTYASLLIEAANALKASGAMSDF